MRRIDASERPMPEINPAKVCFVIEKSRELLSEDVGMAPDASNPTDDGERIMLTDAANSIRRELVEFIRDLDVDEAAALVALAWIGRGRLRGRRLEERGRRGRRPARGADLEISARHGAPAGLSAGRALGLRPVLRGLRTRRRVRADASARARGGPLALQSPGERPFCAATAPAAPCPIDPPPAPLHRSLAARLRSWFFTGLVVFGPVAVTAYIAWFVIDTVDNWVKPWLPQSLSPDSYLPFHVPGFGVVIALVGLTLLGFLTANIIGRSLVDFSEAMLDRTPLVRGVYKGLKQVFETVFSQSGIAVPQGRAGRVPGQGKLVDRLRLLRPRPGRLRRRCRARSR